MDIHLLPRDRIQFNSRKKNPIRMNKKIKNPNSNEYELDQIRMNLNWIRISTRIQLNSRQETPIRMNMNLNWIRIFSIRIRSLI